MSASTFQTLPPTPQAPPTLGRRILRMSAVWAALGAIIGGSVGLESGGAIGAIATIIAGMIELAILGAIFGLIGGTPKETLHGALMGITVGLAVGVASGQAPIVLVADFGLVVGAIAGATLRPYVRLLSLPVVLLGRILPDRHRRSLIESSPPTISPPRADPQVARPLSLRLVANDALIAGDRQADAAM